MESNEVNINKAEDGLIDRSKVRILLCDNDMKSCDHVFSLLLKCSYQVTRVRSARQMIDALNAEGPEIDIILAEVDLPITKGMKMLKYITRDKELGRIPIIMMSAKDEVPIVVKCLRLGAADYLLKPLRTNELLNLWTHMWRRRRMLGLTDKNILNYGIELTASDHSDANTISSNLFSDDTDDKSQKSTNAEMGVSTHQKDESAAAAVEPPQTDSSDYHPGLLLSDPKKSELEIGGSSAFFTYVKSNALTNNTRGTVPNDANATKNKITEEILQHSDQQAINDAEVCENRDTWDDRSQGNDIHSSSSVLDLLSVERSSTPPVSIEFSQQGNFREDNFLQPRNEPQHHVLGLPTQSAYPCYTSGVLNQVTMPSSSTHLFQNNLPDLRNHASSSAPTQYNHLQQWHCYPHVSGMPASFLCYPVNMCVLPGKMQTGHSWPTLGNSSSDEKKVMKVDRREAALIKFRQKRKERCFDKKIRYASRKSLAEKRTRVRGQFTSKVNGVTIDLNGLPASEDEEDKDMASMNSYHEDDISGS